MSENVRPTLKKRLADESDPPLCPKCGLELPPIRDVYVEEPEVESEPQVGNALLSGGACP
jgi:hypothetical protein